jgi:hypothetical protein
VAVTLFWITSAPLMFPPSDTPTEPAPWARIVPLVRLTFPFTAAARRPTLLSPRTLIVPPVREMFPAKVLSTAMPAELLPSMVMLPLLRMLPVKVPPDRT